jgi:hypothetical protein
MARKRSWKNGDVLIKRDFKGVQLAIAIYRNGNWITSNFYYWRNMKHHYKKVHKFKSKGFSYSVYAENSHWL